MPLIVWHGGEDAELCVLVAVHRHDGCYVTATITVVGCRPYGYDRLFGEVELYEKRRLAGVSSHHCGERQKVMTHLVTLIYQLMRSCNCCQTVDVVELCRDLVSKQPTSATWTDSPCIDVFWITPHKIAESALMRDLLGARNDADLVNRADLGTETAVDAENGTVDNGGKNKKVKHLAASLPDRGVAVLLLALLVETVDLGDLSGLVITAH